MKHATLLKWKRYRSEFLTCTLIASMLMVPLDDRDPRFGAFLAMIQFALLFVGASYMAGCSFAKWVLTPIACIWVTSRLLEGLLPAASICRMIAPIAGLILSCTILVGLFRRFRAVARITTGIIAESILTYLVIAIAFSQLYWALDRFMGPIFDVSLSLRYQSSFLYFSMVTLSGLGYSAAFPTAPTVQLIAALENMTGLFYIALVVSRLVSSYRLKEEKQEEQLLRRIYELVREDRQPTADLEPERSIHGALA